MKQKKIILLLKSINKPEIRPLKAFFNTPFFNSNPTITAIFEYLIKYYPDFPVEKIKNEAIHQKFFRPETYKARKINDLLSDVSLLVEEFMRVQLVRKDGPAKSDIHRKMLKERNLNELHAKNIRKNIATIQEKTAKNEFDYERLIDLKRALTETPKFNYLSSEYADILNSTTTELDEFFILTNLKNQIAQKALLKVSKTKDEFDKSFIPNEQIADGIFSSNPLIDLYRLMLNTYDHSNLFENFTNLKEAFYKYLNVIDDANSRLIYAVLQNMASSPIASSELLERDAIELYKIADQKDWLAPNGVISPLRYINICIAAYKIKAYDWADSFTIKYQKCLPPEDQEDTILLGQLYKYNSQNQWLMIIETLDIKRMKMLGNNLRSRTLLIRSCYSHAVVHDDEYFEKVLLEVEAFERYIKRKDLLSPQRIKSYLNFTTCIKKLVRIHESIDLSTPHIKKSLSQIEEIRIEAVSSDWIKEKTNELFIILK